MASRLPLLLCLLALLVAAPARAAASGGVAMTGGALELQLNAPLLADLGVELLDAPPPLDQPDGFLRWPNLRLSGVLRGGFVDGDVLRPQSGALAFPAGLALRRADGAVLHLPELRLAPPDAEAAGEWTLRDGGGEAWFNARAGFPRAPRAFGRFDSRFIDLQVAPALARWAGRPEIAGASVGRMATSLDLVERALPKGSCPLNWPGTPGFVVDVGLVALYQLQAQCAVAPCSGPGSSDPTPRVKLTPGVTLRNIGTADVPWVGKFLQFATAGGIELTHPYPQPDQHPMLVWNAYRLDADGRLRQVGRSGLKHAFATENLGCTCNPDNWQILGPQCSDRYDVGSNDYSSALAPRSEVIASDGRWGRCGSAFDPECSGQQTWWGNALSHRLLLPEPEIDGGRHAGARWFVDAWYVVRDDAEPLNTMGWREFVPSHVNGAWLSALQGSFQQGPLLQAWVDLGFPATGWSRLTRISTAEGEALLGVRVSDLGGGRARYDYALLNHSMGRPQTAGAEPNLTVLANPGIFDLVVPMGGSRRPEGFDADPGAGAAPWAVGCNAEQIVAFPPAGQDLPWGAMLSLSFFAEGPPQDGTARIRRVGDLPEDAITANTLVPAAAPDSIFADGFHDPCDIAGGAGG